MLYSIHSVLEGLRQWSESCPCHACMDELTLQEARDLLALRRQLQLPDTDGVKYACPLAGLRAAEMAAGDWQAVGEKFYNVQHQDLLETVHVNDQELSILVDCLQRAKTLALDELSVKLNFWRCLPWRLCALAHHREETAREHAAQILAMWDMLDQDPSTTR